MVKTCTIRRFPWARPALSAFLCVALLGCSPPEPVRIGFVGGTSGRTADLGVSGHDAVQLAVEQCNEAGGVTGRRVQLIVKDDEQQPDVARQVVQELVDEGVAVIIGPMTSGMGVAVSPIADQAKILLMSPTVTTEELSGKDDYFFRVSSTTREFARRTALYQLKTNRMRRVAAVYDLGNRAFSENWLKNFTEAFAAGGQVVLTLGFEVGNETTFKKVAGELFSVEADGILIIANSMDSALLCQHIRRLDAKIPIVLSDWGGTERLLELGGKAVEGVNVVQTFDRNSTAPLYQAFRQTYLERFHREPGFPGVYAYDATNVVLESLRQRKSGQSIKETVLAIRNFEGLQSTFSFDDYGDVKRPHISISVVRDGRFLVVE
ncbi:MAG TPA: ABC transporter substrate-binding protein [Syntrophobacteraceae bacterium]|nr:ABC transporter substrate-binding protein [Syntrophobacteraceae bacterium]